MRVGIIGATGRAGARIAEEAAARGHQVRALVRDARSLPSRYESVVEKAVLDLEAADLRGLDVLVSAYGVPLDREAEHLPVIEHLIGLLRGSPTRLIVVGSAGHLFTDASRTRRYYEAELPAGPLRSGSRILQQVNQRLLDSAGVTWTYLAPAVEFLPEGPRTGSYQLGGDVVLRDPSGRSHISYADYALAVLDEAERPRATNRTATVATTDPAA
ncbi:NAD(P)-dependent oxidoreductase [Myceligenerans indicum]|uniref:NAD(P)H-binding protein n=1 Tax=Myceligenerans indicum TaxID=2593663 RepID=A0ABS1LN01_9MICO|nr:NAD(P)H-binding protein [Myceligenerans indicum]MBL0887409.1 NAD(P)H-binding protein [Myceligenerans indicum]